MADRQRAVLHHDADSLSRARGAAADTRVYLVQREVADRIVAAPGSKTYGALSVNVQAVARRENRCSASRPARSSRRRRWRARSCVSSRAPTRWCRRRRRTRFGASCRTRSECGASRCGASLRSIAALDAAWPTPRSPARRSTRRFGPRRCRPLISPALRRRALQSRFVSAKLKPFEFHRHVHRLHRHVRRRVKLRRREVEHRLDARAYHDVHDALRFLARHGQHDDVRMLAVRVALEVGDVANRDSLELPADLVGVVVVGGEDREAALAKAAILRERRADLAGADDHDAPLAAESEDLAQPAGELGHGVAEPALAEGSEERKGPFGPGPTSCRRAFASSSLDMVVSPRCSKSSRKRRYAESRRTVESAMRFTEPRRLVNSFTS